MKENQRKQFEAAYDELAEPIFRHCFFRLYNRERSKEITQEVFMKTWDYIRKGQRVDNMRAFLYKVANNLLINELERKKPTDSLDEMFEQSGFDPMTDETEKLQDQLDGRKAMEQLSALEPSYREAILMRYVDDLTVKEIALALGESESNISVRIHRGLKKLKEIYKQ